ncbi:MAG: DUF2326 domain-containing protein [Gammaproteobacteria bacterium]
MKLSRIYTNKPEIFRPIDFNYGLNVVLAEILLPENKDKDTHNLGKTTLCKVIDFCLLSDKHKSFFLLAYPDLFQEFVFFIEIQLSNHEFITIKRIVNDPTKISLKTSTEGKQDYVYLPDSSWNHTNVPLEKAKKILDGILNLQVIKPWEFRTALSYILRSQEDFGDVFHLKKMYKHSDWKPYLAHIMGFNSFLIEQLYIKEEKLDEIQKTEKTLSKELDIKPDDISKVDGMLLLKQKEIQKKQSLLDAFDFRDQDKIKTNQLVNKLDDEIQLLNKKRYYLLHNRKKIESSLQEHKIIFNIEDADKLFKETGVLFSGQIKKDFTKLIEFNKSITEERAKYLTEEQKQINQDLLDTNKQLNSLGKKRSDTLAFLGETDIFVKYKKVSDEISILKSEIITLDNHKKIIDKLHNFRKESRLIQEEKEKLQILIEDDVSRQNSDNSSFFSSIRLFFSEIIEEVISRKALLNVSLNTQCHLEFTAEILDENGNITSEAKGYTYQKLLCIAFDMAIARAYHNKDFPHFIFHDGVFETLDDRKKTNLLNVIRDYSSNYNVQQVITLIDSDLPSGKIYTNIFEENEIVLFLNDKDKEGRLFNMDSW